MKIRWKFFVVLLAFSLIPLWVVTTISHRAARNMGNTIADNTHDVLTEIVSNELEETAQAYAYFLSQEKEALELVLDAIGRNAGLLLVSNTGYPMPVYFAEDYDQPEKAPADYAPNPQYQVVAPSGETAPAPVSFGNQVYYLAPGVKKADYVDEINKLSHLLPTFQSLAGVAYRLYVSLADGVHVSYPGHGYYPQDYDPRLREWYLRAPESGEIAWNPYVRDASTGEAIFSASKRFNRPDGSFAGVVALDIPIKYVLQTQELSSQWSDEIRSFLVVNVTNTETKKPGLLLLAQKETAEKQEDDSVDWLLKNDPVAVKKITSRLSAGKPGITETVYNGQGSICVHAPIDNDLGFIIIAPQKLISAVPEQASQKVLDLTQRQRRVTGVAALLVLIAVALVAYKGSQTFTRPILELANASKRLAEGDFSIRLKHNYNDELDLAFETFNEVAPKLEEHLQMTKAMELAQEVQQNLLPRSNPMYPGFDIAGTSLYCDQTGGDYFDFVDISKDGDKKFAVVVGDVSGHGISSALLMATARAFIRLRASMPGEPAAIIRDVNRHMSRDTYDTGQFMTLFYSEFEPENNTITWVRAGHDPAIVYEKNTDKFTELKGDGLALGLDEDFEYSLYKHNLLPGQVIVIGTDGIWEMHNEQDEMFGKESLKDVIRLHSDKTAGQILSLIIDELDGFRGNSDTSDDVTMVVIKVES